MDDPEAIDRLMKEKGNFYAWECFSLITNKRTLDFIVRKRTDLLVLIHSVKTALLRYNMSIGGETKAKRFSVPLSVYKRNLVQMKIAFASFLASMDVKAYMAS